MDLEGMAPPPTFHTRAVIGAQPDGSVSLRVGSGTYQMTLE